MSVSEAVQPRRLGANDPCWCGSGLKYKRCHRNQDLAERVKRAEGLDAGEHRHLEHLCDWWRPPTNQPAALQQAFFRRLSQMRRDGAILLHIRNQAALARDEGLFEKALDEIEKAGVLAHFGGIDDPDPEQVALAQRVCDRLFGAGAVELVASGMRWKHSGETDFKRTPGGRIGYWGGAHKGLGPLLTQVIYDTKKREGIDASAPIWMSVALGELLLGLEEARSSIAEWVFPYREHGADMELFEFDQLVGSILDDWVRSDQPQRVLGAIAVGLWLRDDLADGFDTVAARHKFDDETRDVIEPFWDLAHEEAQARILEIADDDWATPEGAARIQTAAVSRHESDSAAETMAELEMPALERWEVDETKPRAVLPAATKAELAEVFGGVDAVHERFRQERDQIATNLAELSSQRNELEDHRATLRAKLAGLDEQEEQLGFAVAEVEDNLSGIDRLEIQELARAISQLMRGAGERLSALEEVYATTSASEGMTPETREARGLLMEYEQLRASGTLDAMPVLTRRVLNAQVASAQELLGKGNTGPEVQELCTLPVALGINSDSHGKVHLRLVFPRLLGLGESPLADELTEAVVQAARTAMFELGGDERCEVGFGRDLDPGLIELSADSEDGEPSEDLAQVALEVALEAEERLAASGIRFAIRILAADSLAALTGTADG